MVLPVWVALQRRPRLLWALALASVATLPGSWLWWSAERAALASLDVDGRREQALQPLSAQVRADTAAWQALQLKSAQAKQALDQAGASSAGWAKRSLTVENQKISRAEADQYLHELVSGERTVFAPSVINVRAATPGESVFGSARNQDHADALVLTLKAELYTRGAP